MTTKQIVIFVVAILALIIGGYWMYATYSARENAEEQEQAALTDQEKRERVETYIRENISTLSPEKEVLGGKFIVSVIDLSTTTGTVLYEDGHNLFQGTFSYSVDDAGVVTISSFDAEKNPSFDTKG